MNNKRQTLRERILIMSEDQKEQFLTYFPHKVYTSERMMAILVSISQLFMILSFLLSSKPIFSNPRARSYFLLYIFLLSSSVIALIFYHYALRRKKYPLFMWVRRMYSSLLCIWVIGITYLEQAKGQGITVFCYFLPCAAAVVLLFPKESITIFGITWVIMAYMLWSVDVDGSHFSGNLINMTFVTILAIFVSYRYYQSMAKEFCDRQIIENQYQIIEKKNEQLQQMLHLDQLTGLYNRRYLLEHIHPAYATGQEKDFEGLIIMLDIDYFKKYNDFYGHVQGDECLRQVSKVLKDVCEKYHASAIRYGGEEFMLAKFEEEISDVVLFSNDLLHSLQEANIPRSDVSEGRVTVSIGVWHGKTSLVSDIKDAIKFADEALYNAKETGRNKVIFYGN